MTTKQAINILSEMNKWRRGEEIYEKPGTGIPYPAETFGEAIDTAVEALQSKQPITRKDFKKIIENIYGEHRNEILKRGFEDSIIYGEEIIDMKELEIKFEQMRKNVSYYNAPKDILEGCTDGTIFMLQGNRLVFVANAIGEAGKPLPWYKKLLNKFK